MAKPEEYFPAAPAGRVFSEQTSNAQRGQLDSTSGTIGTRLEALISFISSRGYVFEPWQVAAFVTAVRTKAFVILAGISGTGKTKLPRLVAEGTGADCQVVPVRPNWTESSALLGYERISGEFVPGKLLRFAQMAQEQPEKQFFFVLDELNLARVEYYLAEILSHMEEQQEKVGDQLVSRPLMPEIASGADNIKWGDVRLPENLCIVGSVNMDETTFGFSKKVLDRAFVIELSTVDLTAIGDVNESVPSENWLRSDWRPRARSLAEYPDRETPRIGNIVETLITINNILQYGQLQFGYRLRDEIVLFCLAAQECISLFVTSSSGPVDPLDLAIAMKILPRIQGGGPVIRRILEDLQKWASPETGQSTDEPGTGHKVGFPLCAERIRLMAQRLKDTGFVSFWL